jgi:hypothetical protein
LTTHSLHPGHEDVLPLYCKSKNGLTLVRLRASPTTGTSQSGSGTRAHRLVSPARPFVAWRLPGRLRVVVRNPRERAAVRITDTRSVIDDILVPEPSSPSPIGNYLASRTILLLLHLKSTLNYLLPSCPLKHQPKASAWVGLHTPVERTKGNHTHSCQSDAFLML